MTTLTDMRETALELKARYAHLLNPTPTTRPSRDAHIAVTAAQDRLCRPSQAASAQLVLNLEPPDTRKRCRCGHRGEWPGFCRPCPTCQAKAA